MHTATAALIFLASLLPVYADPPLFPRNGIVKILDADNFHSVLAAEKTAIVAFVAPWCGYCKRLAPEYMKAADSLAPLVPFYAMDCDDQKNRQICGAQEVKGFPTIKSFPRGLKAPPRPFNSNDRTASPIVEWAKKEIPNHVKILKGADAVKSWTTTQEKSPKTLLLTTAKNLPTLWRVLGFEFTKRIQFAVAKDEDGSIAKELDIPWEGGKSKVAIWKSGKMTVYDGELKHDPLSTWYDGQLRAYETRKDEL